MSEIKTYCIDDGDLWWLVAPCASGVRYQSQAGGIACEQPSVEGAVVGVKRLELGSDLERDSCRIGCWAVTENWTPENVQKINNHLYVEIGEGWELDPDRLSESYEGWLWLRRPETPPEWWDAKDWYPTHAVLCGPNCD